MDFINLLEVEALAQKVLDVQAFNYYSSGAVDGFTVKENRECFNRLKLLPRMMRDVSTVDTTCDILGIKSSMPVWVAPMAMHGLAHSGREVATCKAAASLDVPFTFSTVATSSFEDIASTGHPNTIFQLYVIKDRNVVRQWIATAERLGFKALMVTVDAPRLGRREADERIRFRLPSHLQLKNLELLSKGSSAQARDSQEQSGLTSLFQNEMDASLDWSFLGWLKSVTHLPVLVKGVLAPDDAVKAVEAGAAGIVVSNHGGRQLDYAPSALEMLPAIVSVVKGRVPVLMDGGIRRGSDVVKALASGAAGVLLGRPVLYGLALGGQAGVHRVLSLLKAEIELTLALCGCASLQDVGPHLILPPQPHPSSIEQARPGAFSPLHVKPPASKL